MHLKASIEPHTGWINVDLNDREALSMPGDDALFEQLVYVLANCCGKGMVLVDSTGDTVVFSDDSETQI